MSVSIVERSDGRAVRRAARLECAAYGTEPRFVAEPDRDVERRLGGRSLVYADADWVLLVAGDAEAPVARCVASVQPAWQQAQRAPTTGFIGDLVVRAGCEDAGLELITAAESWVAERGIDRVWAPYSHMMVQYLLRTGGHDEDPTAPFRWDPPQTAELLQRAGYQPSRPGWTYRIDLHADEWHQTADRALSEPRCRIRPLDKRRWDTEMSLIADLLTATFIDEWEFQPVSADLVREIYRDAKPVTAPEHVLFAEVDGQPVGLCLTFPNFAAALRRARGRTGPIAGLRFLRDFRRVRSASIYGVGVVAEHRGKGIARALVGTALRHYASQGFSTADYHLVNDENRASRALASAFGGQGRVLHHGFERRLD